MTITKNGNKLAWKLADFLGYTRDIANTCSLLHRAAVTHHSLCEQACTAHPAMDNPNIDIKRAGKLQAQWEKRIARDQDRIEERIKSLCQDLPHTDNGPITPIFTHDPRGATVKLTTPDHLDIKFWDDWGQTGYCVKQV